MNAAILKRRLTGAYKAQNTLHTLKFELKLVKFIDLL